MLGMFGRTEWDMKLPQMRSEEQYRAFRRVLLVRMRLHQFILIL